MYTNTQREAQGDPICTHQYLEGGATGAQAEIRTQVAPNEHEEAFLCCAAGGAWRGDTERYEIFLFGDLQSHLDVGLGTALRVPIAAEVKACGYRVPCQPQTVCG